MNRIAPWLLILFGLCLMAGCAIPVYVRPEMSENNKPIPIAVQPVAPAPSAHDARFDDALAKPAPPAFDWGTVLAVLGGVAGVAGGGWAAVAQRGAGVLRTALRATAEYADRVEQLDPKDEQMLRLAKAEEAAKQRALGVHEVIARERKAGK